MNESLKVHFILDLVIKVSKQVRLGPPWKASLSWRLHYSACSARWDVRDREGVEGKSEAADLRLSHFHISCKHRSRNAARAPFKAAFISTAKHTLLSIVWRQFNLKLFTFNVKEIQLWPTRKTPKRNNCNCRKLQRDRNILVILGGNLELLSLPFN